MSRELARGWKVLLAATLGASMATTAIPLYTIGVFIAPLEVAKGWSRTDISVAITVFGFTLPLSMLMVGNLIERFGTHWVAASGHLILGLTFLALSLVGTEIWQFWALYIAAALLAVGASPVAFTRALIGHFDQHRGLALGICMSGAGLGAAIMPPLLSHVIATYGWPMGFRVLGAVILCLIPVTFSWLRHKPAEQAAHNSQSMQAQPVATLDQCDTTRLISLICVLYFVIALSVNGYVIHMIPLLLDSGISATQAGWIGGLMGIAVIVGRLVTGYLLDKIPAGLLGATIFLLALVGILLWLWIGVQAAPVTAILIGLTIGAEVDLVAYLISRLFPQTSYARFFAWVYSAFMLGSGLSPLIAGWIVDRQGSYNLFIQGSSVALIIVSITFLLLHLSWRQRMYSSPPPHSSEP